MKQIEQIDPIITKEQAQRAINIVLSIAEFATTPQFVVDPAKLDIDVEELIRSTGMSLLHKQNYGDTEPTITPTHFASREGNRITEWVYGPIPYSTLALRDPHYIQPLIDTPYVQVHAFFFGKPNDDFRSFGRWDCVNGWTLEERPRERSV